MQEENLQQDLLSTLKNNSNESSVYRKALIIYQSIMKASSSIANLNLDNDSSFALFIYGSVWKLLAGEDCVENGNVDGLLVLINRVMPFVNMKLLVENKHVYSLEQRIEDILYNSKLGVERTPLIVRLSISILYHCLSHDPTLHTSSPSQKLLFKIFDSAVQSHRTNILSKESSKMLCHLVRDNTSVSKCLSFHMQVLMQNKEQNLLYLNNVREVIVNFQSQRVNDIIQRVVSTISRLDPEDDDNEEYLAQSYYLVEKVASRLFHGTLERLCKSLISHIPTSSKSEKITYCYLQALASTFSQLSSIRDNLANNYVSATVGCFLVFVEMGGKVEKHACGLLRQVLGSLKPSLWRGNIFNDTELQIQNMNLDDEKPHFSKLVWMLCGLFDTGVSLKQICSVLQAFFSSLDSTAATPDILRLINQAIERKAEIPTPSFRKLFHSIFDAFSLSSLCEKWPIDIKGDIASEDFQNQNNLWVLDCLEGYDGEQSWETFMSCFYPTLQELIDIDKNDRLNPVRKEGYRALKDMIWRCMKVFARKPKPSDQFEPVLQTMKEQIPRLNNNTIEHIAISIQILSKNLKSSEYVSSWPENLIKQFAKLINMEEKPSLSSHLLNAIKALSLICESSYLYNSFDRNIKKIMQSKKNNTLSEDQSKQLKNLEILIAVTNGINFNDKTVIYEQKGLNGYTRGYARDQLIFALISQLMSEDNVYQKKAYKYLLEITPLISGSQIQEVLDLLDNSQIKTMSSSKHYRLQILEKIWGQLILSEENLEQAFLFMKQYLPEILIALRETNQRTRRQAQNIFHSFCKKMEELSIMTDFIETVCVGLASETVEVKIATLNGLSLIIEKKYSFDFQFSLGILDLVLMLLHEKRPQLYKSIIQFFKKFILHTYEKHSKVLLEETLPQIIKQLFEADENSKLEHRSILKHFLLKLVKKFSRQSVEKMIPVKDRKFLSNSIKCENREKKKKKQQKIKRRQMIEEQKAKKKEIEQDDEEQLSEEQDDDAMEEENQNLQGLQNENNLLMKYDLEKENFHFEPDKLQLKIQRKKEAQKQKADDEDGITFGADGMMVVKNNKIIRERVPRQELEQEQNAEKDKQGYVNLKKKKKLSDVHIVKEGIEASRSKRAGGDVKTKEKPEPMAFIQFSSKALNKRFKSRAVKVFDNIFQKKAGGLKGIKSKMASKLH